MSKVLVCVGIMSFLVVGAMAQLQETDEMDIPGEIDIQCALAIFSALKHLEQEPPSDKGEQPFSRYVRAEFRITCNTLDDEAHVYFFPTRLTRGGDISYTIGLEDFDVKKREFGR